jgi:hypothetical protein
MTAPALMPCDSRRHVIQGRYFAARKQEFAHRVADFVSTFRANRVNTGEHPVEQCKSYALVVRYRTNSQYDQRQRTDRPELS